MTSRPAKRVGKLRPTGSQNLKAAAQSAVRKPSSASISLAFLVKVPTLLAGKT
ncbi:hypothetical protein PtA15_14A368 [Puccinia triticina]|uniref:Uncharacterized protein n=1 Tax=Puccinia triticina TaxID=208348 RepID=A0ABY7D1M2_9BASI|nr:uncharacterized protein PtA15_14A368 [Puccinia triticina]WAQ91484.1 hypothetical protein PtA15_14A368 [Puccinia triticina]